ncbi:protein of unknown function [Devosia crocina]|uniref:DUF4282 domain-containing protein n=1 Tax=Devosia crocina TaxID=429728 RepID=A0A1I7NDU6_9HYPH|nr:DUF4282 domain-containing protein [Devosia crocina]SFV32832.1 protein of unknown function [Devosia crocina]
MTTDDLKRLLTRQTLFRLDAVLSPRLVPILYALGLAAILLWAINHFFFRFGMGFGNGLWGLLEIVVFGLTAFFALRIGCEALLVWFRANEATGATVTRPRYSASLLDEVRDAIRDLAERDDETDYAEADNYYSPATDLPPDMAEEVRREPSTSAGEPFKPRRTAKRTPPSSIT